jgi:hypothetical protein
MNVEDIVTHHEKTYGIYDVSGDCYNEVGIYSKGRKKLDIHWVDWRKFMMPLKEIIICCIKKRLDRAKVYERRLFIRSEFNYYVG